MIHSRTVSTRSGLAFQCAWLAATCLLAVAVSACADDSTPEETGCAAETRADTYVANLSKVGQNGFEVLLVESQPGPPAKNDNTWIVQLLDDTGTPVDGATLVATPFMPDHGHGTPIVAETTPEGVDGRYQIAPVNLWMPGLWETTIDIDIDGQGVTDSVVYAFCIDG